MRYINFGWQWHWHWHWHWQCSRSSSSKFKSFDVSPSVYCDHVLFMTGISFIHFTDHVSAGSSLSETPSPRKSAGIFPQFLDDLFSRQSPACLSLWSPLPSPFWCDPFFTPTYKTFRYQWGLFTPWWGPFTPLRPPSRGFAGGLCRLRIMCDAAPHFRLGCTDCVKMQNVAFCFQKQLTGYTSSIHKTRGALAAGPWWMSWHLWCHVGWSYHGFHQDYHSLLARTRHE